MRKVNGTLRGNPVSLQVSCLARCSRSACCEFLIASAARLSKMLLCLLLFLPLLKVPAQSADLSGCGIAPQDLSTNGRNIFNERQERDLGDALAEYAESNLRIAPVPSDDQLARIGQSLLETLPKSGITYRFSIYESGEINAFSIAGGRVYVSRKLIAAIQNEDELAGVLAHEIGHIATHQTAVQMTRSMRLRIGVTQVGDRADVFAKVHQFLKTTPADGEYRDDERRDQLSADRVALYAAVRAGYSPESFAAFLDRSMLNNAKTGNWFSNAFGVTDESAQRYRAALKLIRAMPPECQGKRSVQNDAFYSWLRSSMKERVKSTASGLVGDKAIGLDPPLRPTLSRIRFSLDGRYLLAQDEGGIDVVERDTEKSLFRIDAPDAQNVQFTPDSASIVFSDARLRVERWSVSSQKQVTVREIVVYDGCSQTLLSVDGKTLICAKFNFIDDLPRLSLRMVDVDSNTIFFDRPDFVRFNSLSSRNDVTQLALEGLLGADLVKMAASPDSHSLIVTTAEVSLGFDLEHRQVVQLGGRLKNLGRARLSFLGSTSVFVTEPEKGGLTLAQILSYPDGRPIKNTRIGPQQIEEATNSQLLLVSPMKDYAVALFDPMQEKLVAGSKFPAIDAWKEMFATEDPAGGVQLLQQSERAKRIPLPLGELPVPQAAAFSRDGKYLALSVRTRGEIWDTTTGKSIALTRPFRSLWMDANNRLYAQFPKYVDHEAQEKMIALDTLEAKDLSAYEAGDSQFENLQFKLKPKRNGSVISQNATVEVRNMETQTVCWSRDYAHEMPAIWPSEDSRMMFAWDLSSETARSQVKNNASLQGQLKALPAPKKGLLLETLDAASGASLQQVIIPEANLSNEKNDVRHARLSGDFVLATSARGDTTIYRLSNGERVGQFVGTPISTDAQTGIVAALHREDEVVLINERSGMELRRFTLGSRVLMGQIVGTKDKSLLVLTADQTIHRLPLAM